MSARWAHVPQSGEPKITQMDTDGSDLEGVRIPGRRDCGFESVYPPLSVELTHPRKNEGAGFRGVAAVLAGVADGEMRQHGCQNGNTLGGMP